MLSPITGTTDVQASINTVQMGVHQRLQTKRGPIGKPPDRRLHDPRRHDHLFSRRANRDNFGTPWGQAMYNYQWYIGDRTSIVSAGLVRLLQARRQHAAVAAGHRATTRTGSTSSRPGSRSRRPPRSNIYLGYSIIDTGPIKTSAVERRNQLLAEPEVVWYLIRKSYDFGDAILLASMFCVHANRGRLPDNHRAGGRSAARQCFQTSPFKSSRAWARAWAAEGPTGSRWLHTRFAPTQ